MTSNIDRNDGWSAHSSSRDRYDPLHVRVRRPGLGDFIGVLKLAIEVGSEAPEGEDEGEAFLGLELLVVEDDSEDFGDGEEDGDDDGGEE